MDLLVCCTRHSCTGWHVFICLLAFRNDENSNQIFIPFISVSGLTSFSFGYCKSFTVQFCNGWLLHCCVGSSFICVKASYGCLLLKLLFSVNLTPSLPWCHLKKISNVWNLKRLSLFVTFFALACERTFITTHSIERRCYRTGKYTICRHVPESFSPEILQAGAVTG